MGQSTLNINHKEQAKEMTQIIAVSNEIKGSMCLCTFFYQGTNFSLRSALLDYLSASIQM